MDVKGAKNAALQLRNHVMSGGDSRGLLINEVRHFVVCSMELSFCILQSAFHEQRDSYHYKSREYQYDLPAD